MKNKNLIKKVVPYFYKYRLTLFLDLFCAGLTTASEMILPLILRALTNKGMKDLASISFDFVMKLALIYLGVKTV